MRIEDEALLGGGWGGGASPASEQGHVFASVRMGAVLQVLLIVLPPGVFVGSLFSTRLNFLTVQPCLPPLDQH